MHRLLSRLLLACLLLSGAVLGGCAGAPVQEMSNARQAVTAAERAGAGTLAPAKLAEARQLLAQARNHLDHGRYRDARDEAELARAAAVEARRTAESAVATPSVP